MLTRANWRGPSTGILGICENHEQGVDLTVDILSKVGPETLRSAYLIRVDDDVVGVSISLVDVRKEFVK